MREEFTSAGQADFQQRYVGTYGWYPTNNKKHLVLLEEISGGELSFRDSEGTPYRAYADKGVMFDFIPLNKGVYNLQNTDDVIYVNRVPARQWQRGISAANTALFSFAEQQNRTVVFKLLEDIFRDPPIDPRSLMENAKRRYIALSNQFCIADDMLYVYHLQIGKRIENEFVLNSNLFEQEVKDLVKRLGLQINVRV